MLKVGKEEAKAMSDVLLSGQVFRYHPGGSCYQFEERWAKYSGAKYVQLCSSGTTALTTALTSLGIGPGDEVIVPAHTYMATAVAVVNVGAIPVICDIDDSITLCPTSLEKLIRKRTKAVIPVHMWGQICDMKAIMRIARKHKLLVIEDCCQAVGGFYGKKGVGTIGDAGCFSFNFYKNMTCGEGGAIISKTKKAHHIVNNLVDSCGFFWTGAGGKADHFCAPSNRVSELEGAMLNAQLDRLPKMIGALRRQKKRVLAAGAKAGLTPVPTHDPDGECATHAMFQLPTAEQAQALQKEIGGTIVANTGRHTFNEWTPILNRKGHFHPGMDPFLMEANKGCRMNYSKDSHPKSLDLLNRTLMLFLKHDAGAKDITFLCTAIKAAAKKVL
ncbi:MAG: DegT/DnrJ/EryC1/StrS family aminotransferase [Planctomycetota bacterium]|jgi:dTDP-4-amino-4,6-dideoxygalactose transaminase